MKITQKATKYILSKVLYIVAIGASIGMLFFVITFTWISYEVKQICLQAKQSYNTQVKRGEKGGCVQPLTKLLEDKNKGYRARNSAIWALGQIADMRALPILEKYYTGVIPSREPLDKTISQYELRKAIKWCRQGNITSWMYGEQ